MSEFVIPIKAENENDLYATFDPSGLSLSGDVTDYLSDYMTARRPGERVCIEVTAAGPFDPERFREAYLLFVQKLQHRSRREIVKCNVSAIRLLLIGVVFIVIGIIFSAKMGEVIAAIISTIGSFAVWEASAQWIETLPALRKRDRILSMLSGAEMRVIRGERE